MNTIKQPTKKIFLNDVKDHLIEVKKDDGIYRHIRYSQPETSTMYFDLITWPGYLCYTGDMGSYLFSRIKDMFCFFRNNKLEINPGYWSEKVFSESRFGNGITKFSIEEFNEHVLNSTRSYLDLEENEKIPNEIMQEISPLLSAEDEYECVNEMRNFYSDKIRFDDFWEYDCQIFTYHFIWCCYAIVWGIQQYDKFIIKGEKNDR